MTKEDEIRIRILEKSRILFLTRGFSKITMQELSSELGMSTKTIYSYFPNKEKLLLEAVYISMEGINSFIDELIATKEGFLSKIRKFIEFVGHRYSLWQEHAIDDIRRNAPGVAEEFNRLWIEIINNKFTRLINQGVESGEVRKDIDINCIVFFVMQTIKSIGKNDTLVPFTMSEVEFINVMYKIIIEGMLTDKARTKYDIVVS